MRFRRDGKFMKTRTRMGIAVVGGLVIVIVLVVLFTGLKLRAPNNKPLPTETKPPATTETSLGDRYAYIDLTRVGGQPEDYVELTEEELEQFPALQAALQELEDSGKNNIWYKTSEREATAPFNYFVEKHQIQFSCEDPCIWNTIFKYGENYYSIHLVIQ